MSTEARVMNAFKEALDIEGEVNPDELRYREYKKWTSMAHMTLIAILEQDFDAMLETDEILDMSSYGKAVEIMKKYDGGAA
jgi:acyl carrier protein